MTQTTSQNNVGESDDDLTQVAVADLTEYERREVLPDCEYVVVGYDSSYSDKDESTKRLDDPVNAKDTFRHGGVRGSLVGVDHDDPDRNIGVTFADQSGGTIHSSNSSGRIGSLLWVAYPAPEPAKNTYDLTFRALASTCGPGDGIGHETIDNLVEYAVEDYSFDNVEAPPRDERRVEKVQLNDGSGDVLSRDYEWRATVNISCRITVHYKISQSEAVERARQRIGTASTSSYEPDTATWREDLPEIGEHIYERDQTGVSDRNLRKTRYWVENVEIDQIE